MEGGTFNSGTKAPCCPKTIIAPVFCQDRYILGRKGSYPLKCRKRLWVGSSSTAGEEGLRSPKSLCGPAAGEAPPEVKRRKLALPWRNVTNHILPCFGQVSAGSVAEVRDGFVVGHSRSFFGFIFYHEEHFDYFKPTDQP